MSCLETPGPSGPKGHRGQKVSFSQMHRCTEYTFSTSIHNDMFYNPFNNRVLKETAVNQVLKEKKVVQETLVLRVPLVNPVPK